jgi:hypothetical protein
MADTTRIRTNAPRASVTRLEPRLSIAGDVPKHANFRSGSGVMRRDHRQHALGAAVNQKRAARLGNRYLPSASVVARLPQSVQQVGQ